MWCWRRFPCLSDFWLSHSLKFCVPRDSAPAPATPFLVGHSIYSQLRVYRGDSYYYYYFFVFSIADLLLLWHFFHLLILFLSLLYDFLKDNLGSHYSQSIIFFNSMIIHKNFNSRMHKLNAFTSKYFNVLLIL